MPLHNEKPDLEAEAFAIAIGSLDTLPSIEHMKALLHAMQTGRLYFNKGNPEFFAVQVESETDIKAVQ